MIAEAIETILRIATAKNVEIKDVHGVTSTYTDKPLTEVTAAAPPMPKPVEVNSLAGFAELVRVKLEDKKFPTDYIIHIQDYKTVVLKSRVSDQYGRRQVLGVAIPVSFDQFRFGSWMPHEEFAISVAALFDETEDREYILKMASTLTNDATRTSEDDGFTQKATIKAGMRVKEGVTLKTRVELAPYRTFPEINQPVSPFIFRARCDGESNPALMLVEADGGKWKIAAMDTIKAHLDLFNLKVPIVS